MARRVTENVERKEAITLTVDGNSVSAFAGETLATVLLARGITTFNTTRTGAPRAAYCNIGACFECQVRVLDPGSPVYRWRRSCMCPAEPGMSVETGASLLQAGPDRGAD